MTSSGFALAFPDLILSVGGTLAIILGALRADRPMRDFLRAFTLVVLGAAALALGAGRSGAPEMDAITAIAGAGPAWLLANPLNVAFGMVFLATTAWIVAAGPVPEEEAGEWYGLLTFTTLGMLVLARAGNLAAVFLGVETLSLGLYVLIAFRYGRGSSLLAGVKYLLLAGFASAFIVMGMALMFASFGTLDITTIQSQVAQATRSGTFPGGLPILATSGFGLFLAGVGFKLAAAPFHMWAAEVYDAAPAPVSGLIASSGKGATMAALIPFAVFLPTHSGVIVLLAGLSMVLGNLLGLRERNVKRILAYSSIAHIGYVLLGFLAGDATGARVTEGTQAIVFYVVAYSLAILGAFATLGALEDKGPVMLSDLRGLGRRHPAAAACLLVFVASLAGLPPTVGFMGKVQLFRAAFASRHETLAIIGLITTFIGLFYYLRIIHYTFMEAEPSTARGGLTPSTDAAPDAASPWEPRMMRMLVGTAAATVILGFMPDVILPLLRLG